MIVDRREMRERCHLLLRLLMGEPAREGELLAREVPDRDEAERDPGESGAGDRSSGKDRDED